MRVTFKFYTYLKALMGTGELSIEIAGKEKETLLGIIEEIQKRTGKDIRSKLLKDDAFREGIVFVLNGKVVASTKPSEVWLFDGDVISILPPGSGG